MEPSDGSRHRHRSYGRQDSDDRLDGVLSCPRLSTRSVYPSLTDIRREGQKRAAMTKTEKVGCGGEINDGNS